MKLWKKRSSKLVNRTAQRMFDGRRKPRSVMGRRNDEKISKYSGLRLPTSKCEIIWSFLLKVIPFLKPSFYMKNVYGTQTLVLIMALEGVIASLY
jgi:hypothetical protein